MELCQHRIKGPSLKQEKLTFFILMILFVYGSDSADEFRSGFGQGDVGFA